MKREDAAKLSDEMLAELSAELDAGKSDKLVKYLDAMSTFHNYSFGNCMLIAQQRPTATLVAGFHAWKKQGRSVAKGEKGICILAPMVRKADDDEEGDDEESKESDEKTARLIQSAEAQTGPSRLIKGTYGKPPQVIGEPKNLIYEDKLEYSRMLMEEDPERSANLLKKWMAE